MPLSYYLSHHGEIVHFKHTVLIMPVSASLRHLGIFDVSHTNGACIPPPPPQVLTLLFLTCQWIICHNVHQGTRIGRWWRQLARTIVIKRAAAEAKDGHHKAFTIPLIRRGWEGINFQVYHCLKHTSTCSCLPWTRGEWWGNQHNSLRNFAWLQVRSWRGAAALKMGLVVYNAGILIDLDWCRGK